MTRNLIHSVLFRLCAPPVFGVFVYLLILLINNTLQDAERIFSSQELYISIVLTYVAFESMRMVISLMERRLSPETLIRRRLFLQAALTLLVSLSLVGITISAYFKWLVGFSIGTRELEVFLLLFGAVGLLYNLLYFSYHYLLKENRERLEEERKMREKVEADFSSFKSDINPDLLYESLENLILTLHHNVEKAEEQIDHLASIYRYGLVNRQKELISLEEELHATKSLLALLNVHHQDAIQISNEAEKPEEIYLIPGSLLITIDTVVRNTLISARAPLNFLIYREDEDYVVVQHNINDRLLQHQESLQAFSRLQRSYSFFSEKPFVQVKAGLENYIKFPLMYIATENETESA